DEQARAFEGALAFLSYRPRSEREVRARLQMKDVPPPIVESVIERLRRLRLVDDQEFARYWVEQRQTHRPRGARLLRQELRRKGVDADTTTDVLEQSGETEDPVEIGRASCRERGAVARRAGGRRVRE